MKNVKDLAKYIDRNGYYNLKSYLSENEIGGKRFTDWLRLQATNELGDYIKRKELVEPIVRIDGDVTKYGKEPDKIWLHPVLFFDFIGWTDVKWQVAVCEYIYENMGLGKICEIFTSINTGEKLYHGYDGKCKDAVGNFIAERFGFECKFEHCIGDYFVDVYVPNIRLVVELDGGCHSVNNDAARDRFMKSLGYNVFRFHEITDENLNKLASFVEKVSETGPEFDKSLYGTDKDK